MEYGVTIHPQEYDEACQSAFDYIELQGRELSAMDEAAFKVLHARVKDAGLPCRGLCAYCPPDVVIAGERFHLFAARVYAQRLAPRAAALGVEAVGIGSPFSRTLPYGFDRALAWQQAIAFFRETADVFAPYGVKVCVEALAPCYCNFINRFAQAQLLIREADRNNLNLVIDFYNMEHNHEADLPLEDFAMDIVHAHISDDAGIPTRRDFLKPEKGAIHARRWKHLLETGYQGRISLEVDVPFDPVRAERSRQLLLTAEQK